MNTCNILDHFSALCRHFRDVFQSNHHLRLDCDCSESSFRFTARLPRNSLIAYHNFDFILSLIQPEWVKLSCNSCQQNNHKILISDQACSRSSSVHFAADISVSDPMNFKM